MIRVKDELEFHNWFKKNYKKLGFDKIKSYNKNYPDFTMVRDGKEIAVELETKTSNFLLHKHNPKKVGAVICIIEDVKLSIPTIKVKNMRLADWSEKETSHTIKNLVRKLFAKNKFLTSTEVSQALNVSWNTAEKALLELAVDGKLEMIKKAGVNLWVAK